MLLPWHFFAFKWATTPANSLKDVSLETHNPKVGGSIPRAATMTTTIHATGERPTISSSI
jgi:hypothetical protein